ncbi:hypothetical protein E2C01_031955 [Portunus trituberculatus]|uniref:Papilin n=1 Tax=Portunus trituberculatus TaxID=210409 RepID=A0A5B7EZL7_PORTR|nr:hypothetical protein [Portunus trituberculatus]
MYAGARRPLDWYKWSPIIFLFFMAVINPGQGGTQAVTFARGTATYFLDSYECYRGTRLRENDFDICDGLCCADVKLGSLLP